MRLGLVAGDAVADLKRAYDMSRQGVSVPWSDMISLLAAGEEGIRATKQAEAWLEKRTAGSVGSEEKDLMFRLDEVKLLPPVPRPPKIICLAGNFRSHVREGRKGDAAPLPKDIHVFTKFASISAIGHGDPIVMPNNVDKLDYELELGIVIGKRGRYIPVERALEHVGGYTVFNDISDRSYMPSADRPIHWFAMKTRDNSAPMGPCLLLAGDAPSAQDMGMKLWVNGELRQDGRTSDMVFTIAEAVSRLSRWVTLEVGDVVASGTPAGNGWSRGIFLQHGDVIEAEIEGIGRLRNEVVFEEPVYRAG